MISDSLYTMHRFSPYRPAPPRDRLHRVKAVEPLSLLNNVKFQDRLKQYFEELHGVKMTFESSTSRQADDFMTLRFYGRADGTEKAENEARSLLSNVRTKRIGTLTRNCSRICPISSFR